MKESVLETEFDTSQASPGFLLWQITNQWQSEQRRVLLPLDLTHVQFVLLASLVWSSNKDGISQKQLAQEARTDVMMTSQVVRTLEKKGLVTRKLSPTDKRAMLVFPTSAGITTVNKAVRVVEATDKDFFAVLGPDTAKLIAMMQKLAMQSVHP